MSWIMEVTDLSGLRESGGVSSETSPAQVVGKAYSIAYH